MLTRQLSLSIVLFLTINIQAQELSFQTISLSNIQFVEAGNWGNVPLDIEGEDSNSQKFGLIYPAKENGSDVFTKQVTLARKQLFINVEIKNSSNEYWNIKSVELEVLEKFELENFNYREGTWSSASIKTLAYIPYLIIDKEIIDYPPNLSIGPSSGFSDNRFWVKVNFFEKDRDAGVIARFRLKCTLGSKSGDKEKVIQSDKTYLLISG